MDYFSVPLAVARAVKSQIALQSAASRNLPVSGDVLSPSGGASKVERNASF
jgi:hypothetical protein